MGDVQMANRELNSLIPRDFPKETGRDAPRIFPGKNPEDKVENSPCPIDLNSNMTPRLSGSFFYIWFGFLYVQVSSENCETMES